MNQTDYQTEQLGDSQCDIILEAIREAAGGWVTLPALMAASGSGAVHSRIADLRKRGHRIEWRSERLGRRVRSYYRLVQSGEGL